jgi:ketosteroid isomerase-like protein
MKTAPELLRAYTDAIRKPAAVAALFADDGVLELYTLGMRAQGPAEIERFIADAMTKMPDFGFHNVRILIETPDRAFGEYSLESRVVATGKMYKQTYAGFLVAEGGKIKLLREACDTLAAARAFEK